MTTLPSKLLTNYDVTLIFESNLSKDEIQQTVKTFIRNLKFWNGECNKAIYLGKKSLAYPIKKDSRGIFILMKISTNPATINRFQETIRQTETIVRYQIIKY